MSLIRCCIAEGPVKKMSDDQQRKAEIYVAGLGSSKLDGESSAPKAVSQSPMDDTRKSRRTVLKTIVGVSFVVIAGLARAIRNGFFDAPKVEPPTFNLSNGAVEEFIAFGSRLTLDWELQGAAEFEQVLKFKFSVVARTTDGKRMVGRIDLLALTEGMGVRQSGTIIVELREDRQDIGLENLGSTMRSHHGHRLQPGFGRPVVEGSRLILPGGRPVLLRGGEQRESEPEMMEVTIVHSLHGQTPVPVSNMIKVAVTNDGRFSPHSDVKLPYQPNW